MCSASPARPPLQVAGLALRNNYAFIDTVGAEEADTNIQVRPAGVLGEGF